MLVLRVGRFLAGLPGRIAAELAQHRTRTGAMLQSLEQSLAGNRGFTLIELLVVVLIVGILAAIAIPALLNARAKASDVTAKSLASLAQTTAESIATSYGGGYAGLTPAKLSAAEPAIVTLRSRTVAWISKATGTANTYTVTATAEPTGDTYTITRNANGTVSRTCTIATVSDRGGCPHATTTRVSAAYTW